MLISQSDGVRGEARRRREMGGKEERGEKKNPKNHPNAHESVKSKLVRLVKVVRMQKRPLREEREAKWSDHAPVGQKWIVTCRGV
jgi:hypothetical protein